MTFPIRKSSLEKEGMFRASKWLKHAVLLNLEEMNALLFALEPFFLVPATGVLSEATWQVSREEFLKQYELYLHWMESEPFLPSPLLRRFFSLMFTTSLDALYAVAVSPGKNVIKAFLPVIQIQMFHCFFSSFDHQIRSMVISPESFGWGIQISYPQIYEDPHTHEFSKVLLEEEKFPNSRAFKTIVSWLRKNTQPVPLQEEGGLAYAPFRIGKHSLEKRQTHVGLQKMLSTGVKICGS